METIKSYLNNMFANLPRTARVADLKNNILSNMEEKYNELKQQGKSENEAIGIVISEFGNIDELINELGIRQENDGQSKPVVTREEVEAYLAVKKVMGLQVGIGVFLCILASALFVLITTLLEYGFIHSNISADNAGVLGVIVLFPFVAIAVGIFIFSGMKFERYQYMEKGVQIPHDIATDLKQKYDRYTPTFYIKLITGVILIVLSPIVILITSLKGDPANQFGVVILLMIVAIAVFLFITSAIYRDGYEKLLKIGDYAKEKENKIVSAVASVVWPLAVAAFLFCGFVYDMWGSAWIIFPITGVLFGAFSAAVNIITGKKD